MPGGKVLKGGKALDRGTETASAGASGTARIPSSLKPLVIGENMKRVKAYAAKVGGHAYRPWRNEPFNFDLGMRSNARMIKDTMRSGRRVIDIGPDFVRRTDGRAPSPFYNMERRLTTGYDEYTKVFERSGRYQGGAPGFGL